MAAWPSYSLTTVTQPPETMVPEAVRILLENIEASAPRPEQVKFTGELILRGTTRGCL